MAPRSDQKIDEQAKREDQLRKNALIKQKEKEVFKTIEARTPSGNEAGAISATVAETLLEPVRAKGEEWDQNREDLEQGGATIKELWEMSAQMERNIEQMTADIQAYLESIGELTPEKMGIIVKGKYTSGKEVAKLLATGDEKLLEALEFATWAQSNKDEKAVSSRESKRASTYKTLETYLNNPQMAQYARTILALMPSKDRQDFAAKQIVDKKLSADQAISFLKEGNIFSPQEIEELMTKNEEIKKALGETNTAQALSKFNEQDKPNYQAVWQEVNDYREKGKAMLQPPSYGSINDAERMLTLKNVGLFLLQVDAGATLLGNFAVSAVKDGKFRWGEPFAVLKDTINEYTLASGAILGTGYAFRKLRKVKEYKGTSEEKEQYAKQELLRLNNGYQIKPFLEGKDNDGQGLTVIGEFIRYVRELDNSELLPKDRIKRENFRTWLDFQIQKQGPDKEKYTEAKLKLEGVNMPEAEFTNLIQALNMANVTEGQDGKMALDRYNKLLTETQETT